MKIDNQEYLELQENEFYQIIFFVSEQKDDARWLARVRVIRRDTREFIKGGFTVFEHDQRILMKKIKKRVEESLFPELEKAGEPSDWNSKLRKILVKCKALHRRIMDFAGYSNDYKDKDEGEYFTQYALHWKEVIRETIALNRMIEELDDKERIELLTISDNSLKDPSDAWNLEDIDLRIMVFDFFSCPSEKEKQHHHLQRKKLAHRFDELGWS